MGYWDACVAGLADGSPDRKLIWGGPGSGSGTATSWVLPALLTHLQDVEKATGSYHCDFLQWHSKGVLPGMPHLGGGALDMPPPPSSTGYGAEFYQLERPLMGSSPDFHPAPLSSLGVTVYFIIHADVRNSDDS